MYHIYVNEDGDAVVASNSALRRNMDVYPQFFMTEEDGQREIGSYRFKNWVESHAECVSYFIFRGSDNNHYSKSIDDIKMDPGYLTGIWLREDDGKYAESIINLLDNTASEFDTESVLQTLDDLPQYVKQGIIVELLTLRAVS